MKKELPKRGWNGTQRTSQQIIADIENSPKIAVTANGVESDYTRTPIKST